MCTDPTPPEATGTKLRPASKPGATILARLTDVHCHPTDAELYLGPSFVDELKLGTICAMSTTLENQILVLELHKAYPSRVIPFYGIHPWFVHSLSPKSSEESFPTKEDHYYAVFPSNSHEDLAALLPSLPAPTLLLNFLASLTAALLSNPRAMLGEVGIDKSFRLPNPTGGHFSALSTPIDHQLQVVEAQIDVALALGRNISFHSVKASGQTLELLKRLSGKDGWGRINLCLHSFGAKPELIRQIQKAHRNVFFSFATFILRPPRFADIVRAVDEDRILLESDSTENHDGQVWEALEAVREARGWSTTECVDRLERNWTRFCERPGPPPLSRKEKREIKLNEIRTC